MKILLVFSGFKYPSVPPPLGIASIYSYLKKENPGLEIKIFDGTFENDGTNTFRLLCKNNLYDMVCFSVMTTMSIDAHKMAKIVKRYMPGSKVVFWGPHPTVLPRVCLKDKIIDLAIKGEGEKTLGYSTFHVGNTSGSTKLSFPIKR